MSARKSKKPEAGKPERTGILYSETAGHTLKVVARLTPEQARHLRRLARRLECLVFDGSAGYPVTSTRALVQGIASGLLTVSRKPVAAAAVVPAVPAGPGAGAPGVALGGCPKD